MTEQERQIRRADRLRLGAILALCLIVAVPVVVAVAASNDPGASNPAASNPAASANPDKGSRWGNADKGDHGFGDRGGPGRGPITITAKSGQTLTLETDDGWTRTITIAPDTKITKFGAAATLADLVVGEKVRLSQKRNDDGTYTITAIGIPAARAGGEVTSIDGNAVTVTGRKDTTRVITLTGDTVFKVGQDAGTKADIKVGSRIAASGQESGTTFTATQVVVQLNVVGGTVTKTTADTVTIQTRGDMTIVIHVSATTEIRVRGKDAATIADIAVGDRIVAAGLSRADGSLDAQGLGSGKGRGLKPDKGINPPASAKPDA